MEDRIFQVMEHQQYADQINTTTSTPGLLAESLKSDFPEIDKAATITWVNDYDVSLDAKNVNAKGIDVGADFFEILNYPIVQGDAASVLMDKSSIVVSEELAAKFFEPGENVLGKQLTLQNEMLVQISGVFKKVHNSSLQFDFVLSYEAFKDKNDWLKSWGSNGPSTLLKLHSGSSANDLTEKIKEYVKHES
ncbi:MAG: ABC transporter permease [Cytophagales bacterium]|nr:ABC transporter permease [Cytophagales bacterium]